MTAKIALTCKGKLAAAQIKWDDIQEKIADLEREDERLLMSTDWGMGWEFTQRQTKRSLIIDRELKSLEAASREIEEFLIEHEADGWTSH